MENDKKGGARSDSVFSRKFKAGKRRTYFFDVKSTKANDYFLTITESKKRADDSYERFKIFLYKEDFNKFQETLNETLTHIKTQLMPDFDFDSFNHKTSSGQASEGTTEADADNTSGKDSDNTPENSSTPTEEEDLKW